MDCNMPIMDGYEACLRLRELEEQFLLPKTSIIAYTANISESNIKECQDSKFDYILEKPISRLKMKDILDLYF